MDAFHALSDPNRRRIVDLLLQGEKTSGEIVQAFEISAPAVSQHLKTLKNAKIVHVRPEGQKRIYHLNPDGFADMQAWLSRVSVYWNARLDDLEAALAKNTQGDQS